MYLSAFYMAASYKVEGGGQEKDKIVTSHRQQLAAALDNMRFLSLHVIPPHTRILP